jgi:hypothetical protein
MYLTSYLRAPKEGNKLAKLLAYCCLGALHGRVEPRAYCCLEEPVIRVEGALKPSVNASTKVPKPIRTCIQ